MVTARTRSATCPSFCPLSQYKNVVLCLNENSCILVCASQHSEILFPIVPDSVSKSFSEAGFLWNRNNSNYSLILVSQYASIKDFKALEMLWKNGLFQEFWWDTKVWHLLLPENRVSKMVLIEVHNTYIEAKLALQ